MGMCEDCKFRKRYEESPTSLLGRFWRWHIRFCPGWKKFFNSLPEEKKAEYTQKYSLE